MGRRALPAARGVRLSAGVEGATLGIGLVLPKPFARPRYRRLNGVMVAGMPPSMMSFGSPSMSGRKYARASSAMPR